uniref:TNF receptor superfamily member 8 n=1 Tax=Canis lupus dingo TaxID=286419 RepID=A0A8C0K7K4_CANLU
MTYSDWPAWATCPLASAWVGSVWGCGAAGGRWRLEAPGPRAGRRGCGPRAPPLPAPGTRTAGRCACVAARLPWLLGPRGPCSALPGLCGFLRRGRPGAATRCSPRPGAPGAQPGPGPGPGPGRRPGASVLPSPGLSARLPCPRGPSDCGKRCEPDYYLDRDGRCKACVSCSGEDLVEKVPCSGNSSRVCECRTGMFCATSATNTCARCIFHSICATGMVVRFQGTAERDTVCEPPAPATSPDCSTSPEACQAPTSSTPPQARPLLTSSASSRARTTLLGGGAPLTPEDDPKVARATTSPSAQKPRPDLGLTAQQLCPQGSSDCGKQCEPDYYLDRDGRCKACVSCSGDDLVEKTPCTWNSSRVCECRPGMFCATSATNSCARCITHPVCPPGMVTKPQGTAERAAPRELPPPEAHPACSINPDDSTAPTSTTASLVPTADPQPSKERGGPITRAWGDPSISTSTPISFSSTGKPVLVSGPVLFWTVVILVVVLGSVSFVLCHRRACRKWIQQSEWMWPGARGRRGPCTSPEGLCPGCLQPTALSFQSCTSATLSRPSGPSRSLRVSVQMSTGLLGPRGDSSSGPWSGAPCLHSLARQ